MANIVINEISDNYTYNIGVNSYATVALPITASWGPAVLDPASVGATVDATGFGTVLDTQKWYHFPATPQGLDSFVATYRGASSNFKLNKDYSYQMAVTLLTAGYDVLVCRVSSGTASAKFYTVVAGTTEPAAPAKGFTITAKYVGSFGDNVNVKLQKKGIYANGAERKYWNAIISVQSSTGGYVAVENLNFVIDEPTEWDLPDYISVLSELESNFVIIANGAYNQSTIVTGSTIDDTITPASTEATALANGSNLVGGADEYALPTAADLDQYKTSTIAMGTARYAAAYSADVAPSIDYILKMTATVNALTVDKATLFRSIRTMEFNYTAAYFAYSLLQDKLQYAPNRIISPGWDDENVAKFNTAGTVDVVAPLHKAILNAAYYGRCGAGLLDAPLSCTQTTIWNDSIDSPGYAQKLSQLIAPNPLDTNAPLYNTNIGLFAPWGTYKLVGMSKQVHVSASFLALLIARAQILNQPVQYEWLLPTNKKHNLNIGKLDWEVKKSNLDKWQTIEGVSINVIANIPSLGVIVWGNSTLMNVPPATYNALANLSTRYLMNAVENVIYIVGLGITFNYSNGEALSSFKVGITPILDTMKYAGAIEGYKIVANTAVNSEDYVAYQTVVGQIYMQVNGVVNDIICDLVALPPNADLSQFGE